MKRYQTFSLSVAMGFVMACCGADHDLSEAPDAFEGVADPESHDPTQMVALGGQLLTWSSGELARGDGLCPLRFQFLGPDDTAWRRGPSIFPRSGPRCDNVEDDWPSWLRDEEDGGGDFDAPGVLVDPDGQIPNVEGEPTQVLALYYSRYFDGTDSSGQACLGRATASLKDGALPSEALVWEDDGRPILCSNTAEAITEEGERYADPSAGTAHDSEEDWADNTNEALGLDAELFTGFDDKLYMIYGSHAPGMIKIVQLDKRTGRLPAEAQPGWTPENDTTLYPTVATGPRYDQFLDGSTEDVGEALVEAAFVYPHDGFYYLFVNWFRCCSRDDSTYQIVVGRSTNPLGPYVDDNGQSMAEYYPDDNDFDKPPDTPGGKLFLNADMLGADTHRGPGHPGVMRFARDGAAEHVFTFHYYQVGFEGEGDGARMGARRMTFEEGWPVIAEPEEPWDPERFFEATR